MNHPESNEKDVPNTQTPDSQPIPEGKKLNVRICPFAVFSCIVAIFALLGSIVAAFPENLPAILPIAAFASALLAFIVGIVSLSHIGKGAGILTGKGFATIGIAIPLVLLFFAVFIFGLKRCRSTAYRLHCGTNLSGMGKAMLIYANDYDDQFPRAGGPNSKWGPTSDFQAATAAEAYGLNDGPGRASISANFFLLVKFAEVAPKSFLCIRDEGVSKFTLAEYEIRNKDLADLWDFGPDPSKHCSYTYHIPYGPYPLTTSSDPGMAVAADRNPWLDAPGRRARPVTDWTSFDPNGDRGSVKQDNAITHQNDGQNVLFADDHTDFEKTSACGVNGDNIYTSQTATDIKKGILPTMTSQPANKTDSLLLHDPPKGAAR
jgi:hypothetical protein